jgi:hypothetical protein
MPLIDYNTVLQGPLYTVLSTAATLTSAKNPSLGTVAIQVVDKISGIAVGNKKDRNHQHADFETVVPAHTCACPI